MKKLIERKKIILIAFVIITAISLLIHPISGLVSGILAAPAIEGINRYRTLVDEKFRTFDWWNVAAIWVATILSVSLVYLFLILVR